MTDADFQRWQLDSRLYKRLRLVRYGMADGNELEGPLTGLEETLRHFASAFVNVKENYPKLLAVRVLRRLLDSERAGLTRCLG